MRLTLRNMLAYMDGLLEPNDAEDIARKIDESEYATNLMHRIRDVMRRLRLSAPGLNERGPNLDPNTVAEYLDNTLADDRVPDFEKVCLESDVHLAEVGSCHQILTMVLGEAAEIDPQARQRAYRLPQDLAAVAAAPVAAAEGRDGNGASASPIEAPRPLVHVEPPRIRQKAGVPEYLREPRRRRRLLPTLLAAGVLAGLVVLALFVLGQFDPGTPLGDVFRGGFDRIAQRGAGPTSSHAGSTTPIPPAQPPVEPGTESGDETLIPQSSIKQPTGVFAEDSVVRPPEQAAPLPPDAVTDAATAPLPPDTGTATTIDGGTAGTAPSPPLPGEAAVIDSPSGGVPAVADADLAPGTPMPDGAVEPDDSSTAPQPMEPVVPPSDADGTAGDEGSPPLTAVLVEPITPVGRLLSERRVLLRWDPGESSWFRVGEKGMLVPNQSMLALPVFQPEIALSNGVALRMLGGTRLECRSSPQATTATIDYGRFVFMPVANPGAQLALEVGSVRGVVTFSTAESVAAIETILQREPGSDPETQPATPVARLFGVSGEIVWQQADQPQPVVLSAPAALTLGPDAGMPPVAETAPTWVTSETLGILDQRAAATIEQSMTVDRPAETTLLEAAQHRQREVRWLATRCLAHVGHFDAAVTALNSAEMRQEWPDYVTLLRDALARSPESASSVREALEENLGPESSDVYRMLWGYSYEDLEAGQDNVLVKALENDSLAVRRLAYSNLRDLTGLSLYYDPDKPAAQRAMPVQRWRDRAASGEVRRRPSEAPLTSGDSAPAAISNPPAAPSGSTLVTGAPPAATPPATPPPVAPPSSTAAPSVPSGAPPAEWPPSGTTEPPPAVTAPPPSAPVGSPAPPLE
ncbi:MAG: hypothetical protein ACOY3P_11305 [Planctomycetota bacterium]